MRRGAKLVLRGVAGLLLVATWPPVYWAMPIKGRVVDAETAMPLEGVVVVAHWILYGGLIERTRAGAVEILETVTDRGGEYSFTWWAPRLRLPWGWLADDDPQVLLFKPGYAWEILANELNSRRTWAPVRTFDWNRKTIKLRTFTQSPHQYVRHLSALETTLSWAYGVTGCEWKKIPRMIIAIETQQLLSGKRSAQQSPIVEPSVLLDRLIRTFTLADGTDPCGASAFFKQ